jgi:alkanesulfonate monooxygenase SsuD/methylene tetrahydromethanopterin reductase-like flavin-dependent oxidoreductase (luciferase family)
VTYSTTYWEPFHVARLFATMDLMLRGRAAWNIVTSLNRSEAANFGRDEHMGHDARYDRADEFMEVVLGHWNSWEDDALIPDKANNHFADPAKVHRLDHVGRYFRSRGPFGVPRSPQGHSVLIQAGQSGRGQAFAAKWAEVAFVIYHSLEDGKQEYVSFKAAVAAGGRDPARVPARRARQSGISDTAGRRLARGAPTTRGMRHSPPRGAPQRSERAPGHPHSGCLKHINRALAAPAAKATTALSAVLCGKKGGGNFWLTSKPVISEIVSDPTATGFPPEKAQKIETRACRQLSQMIAAARWMAARKFLAVLS